MRGPRLRTGVAALAAVTAWSLTTVPAGARDHQIDRAARYVALGDSISSGEGGLDYDPGFRRFGTGIESCHRSAHGFARVLARAHPELGEPDVRACSRSTTVGFTTGADVFPAPPQRQALSEDTELVTITLGINDLNPELVLVTCLLLPNCDSVLESGPFGVTRRIEALAPSLTDIYVDVRRDAPNASVFAVGYPQLFCRGEEFRVLDAVQLRLLVEDLAVRLGVPLVGDLTATLSLVLDEALPGLGDVTGSILELGTISVDEVEWLRGRFERLNEMVGLAALRAGVHHVYVEDLFAGHQLCDGEQSWVHALDVEVNLHHLPLDHLLHPVHNSFHPTAEGYAELAAALARAGAHERPPNPEPWSPPPQPLPALPPRVGLLGGLVAGLLGRA